MLFSCKCHASLTVNLFTIIGCCSRVDICFLATAISVVLRHQLGIFGFNELTARNMRGGGSGKGIAISTFYDSTYGANSTFSHVMLQTPKDHSDWRKLEEAVSDDWEFLVKGLHSRGILSYFGQIQKYL